LTFGGEFPCLERDLTDFRSELAMVVKAVTAVVGNAAIAKSHGILAHRRQRPAVVIPYTTST
jgi:hypothetical protein